MSIPVPVALAYTAGLVASVNPCGFAMLPAYLAWFVGLDDDRPAGAGPAVGRALLVGGVVSGAFLAVFGLVGLVFTAGATAAFVGRWVPWMGVAIGLGLVVLGVAMLRGFQPRLALPQPQQGVEGRGMGALFVFGVSYAIASLSCTLPVFLAVVGGALAGADVVTGVAVFGAYALGMATVLIAVTLSVALARQRFVRGLKATARYVHPASAVVVMLAGGYLAYFWLATLVTGPTTAGPIAVVERLSARATDLVAGRGLGLGLLLAAGVLGAAAWVVLRSGAALPGPGRDPQDRTGSGVP